MIHICRLRNVDTRSPRQENYGSDNSQVYTYNAIGYFVKTQSIDIIDKIVEPTILNTKPGVSSTICVIIW